MTTVIKNNNLKCHMLKLISVNLSISLKFLENLALRQQTFNELVE